MFKVKILNPKHVLFDGQAESVSLPGDKGEFEIIDYHSPIVSLLKRGMVVVNWEKVIHIARGMVKFYNNECVVLVEE